MPRLPELDFIPGTLGEICRLRAADYSQTSWTAAQTATASGRFSRALQQKPLSLIAEVKQASPSKGHIAHLDPVRAAQAYQDGGASALSVLTEPRYFNGSPSVLEQVLNSTDLPILRKDFTVHPQMITEAQAWGASAILLMVSVLGELTAEYLQLSEQAGLEALVEVHDPAELDIALQAGASIIGVNNRDLTTLNIDLTTAPRLIALAHSKGFKGIVVAESGYSSPEELKQLVGVADAVLVGSSLSGSGDLYHATRQILSKL